MQTYYGPKRDLQPNSLGKLAIFFQDQTTRDTLILTVQGMPSPHTAINVRMLIETVLEEWNILLSSLHTVVETDNGSNMVAALSSSRKRCVVRVVMIRM